jgi:hypothetical protein
MVGVLEMFENGDRSAVGSPVETIKTAIDDAQESVDRATGDLQAVILQAVSSFKQELTEGSVQLVNVALGELQQVREQLSHVAATVVTKEDVGKAVEEQLNKAADKYEIERNAKAGAHQPRA